jgi:2-polyprenyl-6-methoxyphenol hydroxylase-like FAD-dependent oxidoreductase
MRIMCVGGGPAGLYFAILAKRRHPDHEITVVERNPAGATYGWGVVFWDDFLDGLFRNDPDSAREVRRAAVLWEGQRVRLGRGEGNAPATAHLGGYGFSVTRNRLLAILAERAAALGVDVRYEHALDPAELDDLGADLVVASDGVGSALRERRAPSFGTTVRAGRNPYIWLGTSKVFDGFVFAFEPTPAGWIWFHAYPSAGDTSTCIVECAPETWCGLGLHELDAADGTALLERVFADALDGHALLNSSGAGATAPWLTFRQITNRSWFDENVVVLGDAAHTTHFTIGSGTKLAIQDAIGLAEVLPTEPAGLPAALRAYDQRRRAALRPLEVAAQQSMTWFEGVDAHLGPQPDAVQFAYELWQRRGAYPPWRYRLHLATQIPPLRAVRREVSTVRRVLRARRRGELVGAQSG